MRARPDDCDCHSIMHYVDTGFVAKTRVDKTGKKVFLNIVSSPLLQQPREEPNPGGAPGENRIRIPMSCEGPFDDVDKGTRPHSGSTSVCECMCCSSLIVSSSSACDTSLLRWQRAPIATCLTLRFTLRRFKKPRYTHFSNSAGGVGLFNLFCAPHIHPYINVHALTRPFSSICNSSNFWWKLRRKTF